MLRTPRNRALWYWGGPLLVTLVAAVLRFWNLGHPNTLVFDETYYVKDAWTLWIHGYETRWPDGSDASFNAGDPMGFLPDASYVVHPPLGKWIIGLGMAIFGAVDPFWWRATTALAGTIAVFLVAVAARRLTGTTVIGVFAGLLLAVDGNAIAMSRVSLLDTHVMLLALLGFWFVLLDRDRTANLLAERLAAARAKGIEPMYGPAIWQRPWVFAAGAAFGATTAVKWSGIYFVAAFGIYLVVVDLLSRRRNGVRFWATGAILKQAPVTFLQFVPTAFVVYLAAWSGWILTDGGYDRHYADGEGLAWTGPFAWVPTWFQSLWAYHQAAYQFHLGVASPHPWQANPLTWLLMIRPTNMYYHEVPGCEGTCTESIIGIGNPLIWWAATAAALYLVYRLARYREWQAGLVLTGLAAGYLPWLAYTNRTVFEFYAIAFEPYLILVLALVAALILGKPTDPTWRRERGIAILAVYVVAVVAVSIFFYSIVAALPIPATLRQLHFWLPSWG